VTRHHPEPIAHTDRTQPLWFVYPDGLRINFRQDWDGAWAQHRDVEGSSIYRGTTLLSGPADAVAKASKPQSESVQRGLRNMHAHRLARRYRRKGEE
jgi:hypothetical protein